MQDLHSDCRHTGNGGHSNADSSNKHCIRLADVVRIGTPALLDQFGHKLTRHQRRALTCIVDCRTGALGVTAMRCSDCGQLTPRHRSCGHRSCPQCQHHSADQWLQRQQAKLLPVDYFMATFTLPAELRAIAYRHQQAVYPILFAAVADTLRSFGLNHPKLGADLGFSAVLHTHSRRLDYHPHIHVVIPGGGVTKPRCGQRLWRKLEGQYLFNGVALAQVFRGKCMDALRAADIELPDVIPSRWVVQCKHVGQGLSALKYLSKYLYRGIIAERDIVALDVRAQTVTFRFCDSKSGREELRTLTIAEFLWRIALHVLPKGLQRVRHYGFLHGNAKRLLRIVQLVLRVILPMAPPAIARVFTCPYCGSTMTAGRFTPAPASG